MSVDTRPDIPHALERQILVESGHRCSIPACSSFPVEIHHITPWAECREHAFENLIALCPTCHTRARDGLGRLGIDRKALRLYKQKLAVMNGRYSEQERRLLNYLRQNQVLQVGPDAQFTFMYLLKDRLVTLIIGTSRGGVSMVASLGGQPLIQTITLTEAGIAFLQRLDDGTAVLD